MEVFSAALAAYLLGMLTACLPDRYRSGGHCLAHAAGFAGSLAAVAAGLCQLLRLAEPWGLFTAGPCSFLLDDWSAAFVLLLGLAGACANLSSLLTARTGGKVSARTGALHNLGAAAMLLLLLAGDTFTFLLFWEIADLTFFLLLLQDHRGRVTRRAACRYLFTVNIGLACIMAAFLLLGTAAGSLSFAALTAAGLSGGLRHAVFILAFAGCAIKAGLLPIQRQLCGGVTDAHLAAMLNAVMLNMVFYALGRICFFFLPALPYAWGASLLTAGLAAAFTAAVYARAANDLRQMLFLSSLAYRGIVAAALGSGMLLVALGDSAWAPVGFLAALLLTFHHALVQTQLCLAAGSIMRAAGSCRLEELGGLAHAMPWTACAALIGTLGLAALPLTGSFTGLRMSLQGFITLARIGAGQDVRLWAALALIVLGFVLALLSGCCVRFYGMGFLGRAHSAGAAQAAEKKAFVLPVLAAPAFLILFGGIYPAFFVNLLVNALPSALRERAVGLEGFFGSTTGDPLRGEPLLLALAILLLSFLVWRCLPAATACVRVRPAWQEDGEAPGAYDPLYADLACLLRPHWRLMTRCRKYLAALKKTLASAYRAATCFYAHRSDAPAASGAEPARTGALRLRLRLVCSGAGVIYNITQKILFLVASYLNKLQEAGVRLYVACVLLALAGVLLAGVIYP